MKVYEKRPTHSRYEICKAINAIIISSGLLNKPQQISEKKVYKSIDKLARLGYLSKKEIKDLDKLKEYHKKPKKRKPGRPPACLYEIKSISTIIEKVRSDIREKEARIMEVLNSLNEIEEAVGTT